MSVGKVGIDLERSRGWGSRFIAADGGTYKRHGGYMYLQTVSSPGVASGMEIISGG